MDVERARRGSIRWYAMVALNWGRPERVAEPLILAAVQGVPIQCTALELRRELDYLAAREVVELKRPEGEPWLARLTRLGIDIVEYEPEVECEPGIARPKKYWVS